jgi:hypothetical protein
MLFFHIYETQGNSKNHAIRVFRKTADINLSGKLKYAGSRLILEGRAQKLQAT